MPEKRNTDSRIQLQMSFSFPARVPGHISCMTYVRKGRTCWTSACREAIEGCSMQEQQQVARNPPDNRGR